MLYSIRRISLFVTMSPVLSALKKGCYLFLLPLFLSFLSGVQAEQFQTIIDYQDHPQEPLSSPGKIREKEQFTHQKMHTVIDDLQLADICLTRMISSLQGQQLDQDDRDTLLFALLDSRHAQQAHREHGGVDDTVVGGQIFSNGWKEIRPVLVKHLGAVTSHSPELTGKMRDVFSRTDRVAGLTSFDAKDAFAFNQENMTDILRTFERSSSTVLAYDKEVDSALREVLGFDDGGAEVGKPEKNRDGIGKMAPVSGKDEKQHGETFKDMVVTRENYTEYLAAIRSLLKQRVDVILEESQLGSEYQTFFRDFIPATAWQESCFRQFVKKNGRIETIRSYDDSSVGIMQINEKVWKNIYDIERINSDIEYNIQAGCEIAYLYLTRYTIKRLKKQGKENQITSPVLARLLYSMYNGGPGQYHKFFKRHATGKYYRTGNLFFQKYSWVTASKWDNLKICLFGRK